ncbi:MAG: fumarylacetoacetate hydrolase family protein [Actinomycetaceae bacterium]|nr:fumarylacetoacetate hydrolase family protein [Actinomycetaceae bacterium]
MLCARISLDQGPRYALVDGDSYAVLADDPMFGDFTLTGQHLASSDVSLLTPMIPRSKIIGFTGFNDAKSVDDLHVYMKPNTSVIGPEEPLIIGSDEKEVYCRSEVAVIIGRPCKDLRAQAVDKVVFGVTLAHSLLRDKQARGKAELSDASCALGPYVAIGEGLDFLIDSINGEQQGGSLPFTIQELVAYASSLCSLLPGDIILSGSLSSTRVAPSSVMETQCDGIGILSNPVLSRR